MTKLIFLDTETTSLDRRSRQCWDIGYIIREGNTEHTTQMFVYADLADADFTSLKIGGYYQRHPDPFRYGRLGQDGREDAVVSPKVAAGRIAQDFKDGIIIGAVPSFDEETLANLLHEHGLAPTWHYHLIDIESMAAGHLKARPPWNFDTLLAAFGLIYDERDRHTALGDAVMVKELYDAVMTQTEEGQKHGLDSD